MPRGWGIARRSSAFSGARGSLEGWWGHGCSKNPEPSHGFGSRFGRGLDAMEATLWPRAMTRAPPVEGGRGRCSYGLGLRA